jgi:hypothetical protein
VQPFHVCKGGHFHVYDHNVRPKADKRIAQFRYTTHNVNGLKMMAELSGEEAGDPVVFLQQGKAECLHTTPKRNTP